MAYCKTELILTIILFVTAQSLTQQLELDWDDLFPEYYQSKPALDYLNTYRSSHNATNMLQLTTNPDLLPKAIQLTLQCNPSVRGNYTLLDEAPWGRIAILQSYTRRPSGANRDPIKTSLFESGVYDFATRTCVQGDCRPYLTIVWANVSDAACFSELCYNVALGPGDVSDIDYRICVFTSPPHPETDMFVRDPYQPISGTAKACSGCLSNTGGPYTCSSEGLCSKAAICSDPQFGRDLDSECPRWASRGWCETLTGIVEIRCPASCGNCQPPKRCRNGVGAGPIECPEIPSTCRDPFQKAICAKGCQACWTPGVPDWDLNVAIYELFRSQRQDVRNLGRYMAPIDFNPVLQQTAIRSASRCNATSESQSVRKNGTNFTYIAENLAMYDSDVPPEQQILTQVKQWYTSQVGYYEVLLNACVPPGKECRRYLAQIWENTTGYGCAWQRCGGTKYSFACHFAEGGDPANRKAFTVWKFGPGTADPWPGVNPKCGQAPFRYSRYPNICAAAALNQAANPFCYNNRKDTDSQCLQFAEGGLCSVYPGFYLQRCPQSCGNCYNETCFDSPRYNCSNVTAADCRNPKFFSLGWICPLTCGNCTKKSRLNSTAIENILYVINREARTHNSSWGAAMSALTWDPQLASKAEAASTDCPSIPALGPQRLSTAGAGPYTAQAIYTYQNFTPLPNSSLSRGEYSKEDLRPIIIDAWLSEISSLSRASLFTGCPQNEPCENARALLQEPARSVGCGFSDCPATSQRQFICLFFPAHEPFVVPPWGPVPFYSTCTRCPSDLPFCNERVCSSAELCIDANPSCSSFIENNPSLCRSLPYLTIYECRRSCHNCAQNQCFDSTTWNCSQVQCSVPDQNRYCPKTCGLCPPN